MSAVQPTRAGSRTPPAPPPAAPGRGATLVVLVLTCLALAYVLAVNRDARVASLPLKAPICAVAFLAWLAVRGRHLRLGDFPLRVPALLYGLALPLLGGVVGAWTHHRGGGVALVDLRDLGEEASRFLYVLLYFPLADLLGRGRGVRQVAWVGPLLGLSVATWVLWWLIAHTRTSWANSLGFSIFNGILGVVGDQVRIFLEQDVLLGLLAAFALAQLVLGRRPLLWLAALVVGLSALWPAHSRGIWLGLVPGTAVLALLCSARARPLVRRFGLPVAAVGLVAVAVASAVVLAGDVGRPRVVGDYSSSTRFAQAPELWTAVRAMPVLGHGLGARLSDGYVRSASSPWSFELTYLQLLMQVGVVGLALALLPGLWLVWAGVRSAAGALTERRLLVGVGLAGALVLYVAAATNPFLVTAYGGAGLALCLALVGARRGAEADDVPLGPLPRLAGVATSAVLLASVAGVLYEVLAPR